MRSPERTLRGKRTPSRSSILFSATPCVCFIRSCRSSPRSSGTGSVSIATCRTSRGRRRSSSRTGRSRCDDAFKTHYRLTPNDEQFANAKYETVIAGRRLRRDFNIASNKRVAFVLKPSNPLPEEEAAVLRILLNAERLELPSSYDPPKGTPTALTPLGELYLPLEGLIDLEAERRTARERDRENRSRTGHGAEETGERKFRRERSGRGRGRASAAGKGFRGAARAAPADARFVRRSVAGGDAPAWEVSQPASSAPATTIAAATRAAL